jgi:hypothetical protein
MRRVVINDADKVEPLGVETTDSKPSLTSENSFRSRTVPDKTLFNVELIGLADKIKDIKLENQQYELVEKIQSVLNLFDPESNKYNEQIVLFTMQSVENFITKPKAGAKKQAVVVEAVKKYFNNDIELIVKMIALLLPRVKKMNIVRRNWKRVANFFCGQ